MADITEEACDRGGEGKNGVRGTNATRKPKHTRLAAEISTLHASMCTVARTEAKLQKITSIGSAQVVDVTEEACDRGGRVIMA